MTTKSALAKKLIKLELSLSHRTAVLLIDAFLNALAAALSNGDRIELRGFGTFSVTRKAARKTSINGNMTVPEHGRIVFQPSEALRQAVWDFGDKKSGK